MDNLKWKGHVLEWISFGINLNVWPSVLSYTCLLWALVLRFVLNNCGNVLSITGGVKQKLFVNCMFHLFAKKLKTYLKY